MNMSESFSMPFVALTISTPSRTYGAAARATSRVAWLGTTKTTICAPVERGRDRVGGADVRRRARRPGR